MKRCSACKERKEFTEFGLSKKGKNNLDSWCIPCKKERRKAWNRLHKDSIRENRKNDPKRIAKERDRMLRRTYGIGQEQYDQMFRSQDGKCAICLTHQDNFKKKLSVDHNHLTGAVRGLLCFGCNSLLGCARDSRKILESADTYLTLHAMPSA